MRNQMLSTLAGLLAGILVTAAPACAAPNDDLIAAARAGDAAAVTTALAAGAEIEARSDSGATALMIAASRGDAAMVENLLEAGADPAARHAGALEATALMYAGGAPDPAVAALLIAHGADIDAVDVQGDPAVNWAAYYGNSAVLDILLRAGADTTLTGHGNAYEIALRRGFEGALAVIVSHRDRSDTPAGWATLHAAVVNNDAAAVRALSPDIDIAVAQDWAGRPLIHAAAIAGATDALGALIEAGAAVDARGPIAFTPLMLAAREGALEAVDVLLDAGGDVNAVSHERGLSLTPLHLAAIGGEAAVVRRLLEAGAEIDARGSTGATPLAWASFEGREDAAVALLEAGADASITTADGTAPADVIRAQGWEAAITLLPDQD